MPAADARISPTAHYTSYVWFANGMSHEALTSPLGRRLYHTLAPVNAAYLLVGRGPNLEMSLLARHRIIDHLLEEAIAAGSVGQVVEIAAGLSPRGYRFARRHPDLTYVEGDLPDMAAHKRRVVAEAGLGGPRHHVVEIDALAEDGAHSLAARARDLLDPTRGTAIITEGLLGYFDLASVHRMWKNFGRALAGFPSGTYFADLFVAGEFKNFAMKGFETLLGVFARGKLHRHFEGAPDQAIDDLRACGFDGGALHAPEDFRDELALPGVERGQLVRILEGIIS